MGILLIVKYNQLVGRGKIIKTAVKYPDNMVIVFDADGQVLPEYEHLYEKVREGILRNAPNEARFFHASYSPISLREVKKEDW